MVERLSNLTKVNISALSFVAIMNTLSLFIYGFSIGYFLIYVGSFLISAGALLLFRKHQTIITTYFLLILGVVVILSGQNGNFSGAILIIYAIHLNPGRNKTIFKLAVMAVAIAAKTLLIEMTTINVINLMFVHFLCYGYYYILFTEKKIITISEIEDQTEQIMDYLIEGFEIKEIAIKTCLTPAAVSKRINRLRDREGCKTTYQLIYKLSENGHMHKKIDKFKVI